jgi:CheY-like chemotaxis protein
MGYILVVDDDPVIRRLLRIELEASGYAVEEASGGSEAIRQIRKGNVDLMVIDIVMPPKGGIETMIELNTEYPDLKTIVITGHFPTESDAFQNIVKQFGASRVFAKPLDMKAFLKALKSLLSDG